MAWGDCTFVTPDSVSPARSEDEEVRNFAMWFSYHRTRMKIAKAGASEAFNPLGDNVRVGYRTIWNRSNYNIPVQDGNAGRFESSARDTWFARLFAAEGSGGTPLHGALQGGGEYFGDTAASGPYGPETGEDQLNCRQNFAILTTDGYWNNFSGYDTNEVGDEDGTDGTTITNPKTGDATDTYTVSHPYRDGATTAANRSDTLADVAMRYWKNDLVPDMGNFVEPTATNPAFWQHMVTFGISIGLKGTVDQTSVADVVRDGRPRIDGANVDWPNPNDGENAERIDDLLHAAVNGRGEFIAATSADKFRDALSSVLGQIQARLSSGSNVATNSTTFQDGSRIYQATYYSLQWTGDMVARDITETDGIDNDVTWSVNARIGVRNSDASSTNDYHQRTVLTWGGTNGANFPTSTQLASLGRTTGTAPVTAANNASYIKGNQALELSRYDATSNPNALLRNRTQLLGDIINSSPFYIRDTETLYVGANDGMLHAINALTGDIQFSYVPAGVNLSRLATLSDPSYEHAFFVDGPVVVSPRSLVANTNYLLGTLGRGGKGAFALNVSNPASMATNRVMWDKTASADDDMGYVLGTPLILKGNNDRVLAIVPNGIDSTNGSAVLYIYRMDTGAQLAKIDTGATGGNGLSAPRAADIDNDGTVDYVYAGDLLGNVWKFDLTSNSPNAWGVAYGGSPLFTATDESGNAQPITGGLALSREYGTENIWVTFGTGRMISTNDLDVGLSGTQSLYGLIDDTPVIDSRDDLTERSIVAWGTTSSGRDVRAFEEYAVLPDGSRGWFVDLGVPTAGERVVGGPLLYGRVGLYASIIPTEGEGCEPRGAGYLNALDIYTGTSLANGGGTGSASAFDFDGDGSGDNDTFTNADGDSFVIGSIDLELGMPTDPRRIGGTVVICGSGGVCEDPELADPPGGGGGQPQRLSWRELISGE
jgi:type IV pilus assembly protein PilY1